MTPEDIVIQNHLDKILNNPKTWVVKDFNNISNIYLHLDEIEVLITGLNLLIEQESTGKQNDSRNELLEKLSALEERERSRN
jgi:hypothetical protein